MSLAEREQQIYAKISKKLLDTGEKERYVLFSEGKPELLAFKGLLRYTGSNALSVSLLPIPSISMATVQCFSQ